MILVTGASGHIGRRVAELLSAGGHPLRLMVRKHERAPQLPGATVVEGDYAETASLEPVFKGITIAMIVSISGVPPGKRAELHRNAFDAAARGGVRNIVYLSLQGASPQAKYPYSRDHYLSEQYLAATGVPNTILRDSFYVDMFIHQFDESGVIRGPAGNGHGAFVSREDVARTTAAVLIKPPEGIHDVTGPETITVADVAKRLSELVHRPLRYEDAPAVAREAEPWKNELKSGWFEAIAAGEIEPVSHAVRVFTGKEPLTLEAYFGVYPNLLETLRAAAAKTQGTVPV